MPASPESASGDKQPMTSIATEVAAPAAGPDAVLIAGVNWLGDSIMTMPALQAYRRANPRTRLVMLVKPHLAGLWSLQRAIDEVWTLPRNPGGIFSLAHKAATAQFRAAFILPHSFRSALTPFLARIPERIGMPGHSRDWMLTRIVRPPAIAGQDHQCFEYMALFGLTPSPAPPPQLTLDAPLRAAALRRLEAAPTPRIALLPGAAHGPAKRWPAEHYIALGGMLKTALACGIVVLGSASERDLCARVTEGIGRGTIDLAGQTSLPEFAAILSQCALVVANDSGGMHLAAAAGVPVLAIFGITDPQKTGPLGPRARVLQDSARRSRDIEKKSEEAVLSLRRIQPEQALAAARDLLAG